MVLDAAAAWHGEKRLGAQIQAYVMVEVLDEAGEIVPGYERERCVFQDADDPRLPLRWADRDTTSLAGRTIRLRFHFRDATIHACW